MKRAKRRAENNRRGSERSRSMIVLVTMAAIMATGLFATRSIDIAKPSTTATRQPSDTEIYTGSILFEPDDAKVCHQLLFDNRTGLINDNGTVDCGRAYYHSPNDAPLRWSTARAQVISEGFRHH
jgi:hypothetical protein